MTLLIVHLSDIHFRDANDVVLKRPEAIVAALRPSLPNCNAIAVVLSGDIANTGSSAEYSLANRFLSDLKSRLRGEAKVPAHFIISPGNHDCDFRGDQAARDLVVAELCRQQGQIADSFLQIATEVQSDYFAFRKKHENKDTIVSDHRLWTTYSFSVEGWKVAFDALNASWMSSKHEQQGGLWFPYDLFLNPRPEECDLRVVVLHHPLNWYSQSNYRAFRSHIHSLGDFILTGHEHQGAARETDDSDDGHCIYIEGEALQTGNQGQSAFNLIIVDTEKREYRIETLRYRKGRYESEAPELWESYRPIAKRTGSRLGFTAAFRAEIKDPGATLKHFSGKELTLDDFFVFPDLDDRSKKDDADKAKTPTTSASMLVKVDKLDYDVFIQGDDEGGKTRLIYKLADEYVSQGKVPVFLRGSALKSAKPATLDKEIEAAISDQYGFDQTIQVKQTAKQDKIVLLDDFDQCDLNAARKAELITQLRERFGRLILTVGENYEVAEIFGGENILSLASMRHFKILPLGHARRLELIRKWNRIGFSESTSENQFLEACDNAEKLIESTKLKFVASTVPIFVLSLLQATSSGISTEVHNSSFAHYYYFLIVGAFENAKIPPVKMGLMLSICSRLSWFIKTNGTSQRISLLQFRQFVRYYSQKWTAVDEEELLDTLTRSKLFEASVDGLQFSYPYSYYYFLGKYVSTERESQDTKDYVDYCLKHMYARECANTLLFLAHHSGNSAVLDRLTKSIDSHFTEVRPASLNREDVASIAGLLAQAPAIRYREIKPADYREQQAAKNDSSQNSDGLRDSPNEGGRDLFQEIVGLSKAIEIAGTLLTHQYANYDRATKDSAIKSIFDGAMRAVKTFHAHFEDTEELIKYTTTRIRGSRDDKTAEQIEMQLRLAIALLIKVVTTSFVMRAGANLQAKDLDDNVTTVVEGSPTCAYRLIRLAQLLRRPTRLPRLEIDRLRREEGSNPAVMGVLQLLVLQRLYAYETTHDDKDWALGVFEMGGQRTVVEQKSLPAPPKRIN